MDLVTIKEQQIELRLATLAFLVSENKVLLAMKKRGFGSGKWNGAGGKQIDGESIGETAKRELREEVGVTANNLVQMGEISFYFDNKPEWSQKVIVFIVKSWEGEPSESEEMAPKWFDFDSIPYDLMWEDDRDWLPMVLDGKKVKASYLFDENQKIVEKEIGEELE